MYGVVCEDDSRFAVKAELNAAVGATGPADMLETEWRALSLLASAGSAVAQPVAIDRDARFLVTRWAAGATLDDACQRPSAVDPVTIAACLSELGAIERACAEGADALASHTVRRDDRLLVEEFAASFARAREAYYVCLDAARALTQDTARACDAAWQGLWTALADAPTTLGPLDMNARNLVLSPDGPVFLDFATVGWDWPERRVAQYLTAMGRMREDGRVACALTPRALRADAELDAQVARRLEGHCMLTACLAIAGMLSRERPDEWPQWPDAGDARADSARRTLALGGVASFAPAVALRAAAADAWRL
ncbi:hypothetical protein CMK11_22575 [Candidatus Poribacteria bacterium]|nr:hypothetical protein [Candidatus Poribacteria bacterium]